MDLYKTLSLTAGIIFAATLAHADITYVCDSGIAASTCSFLNTTVAGQYKSTFSNANAVIYIQYGTTGLASSTTGFDNQVTYAQYVAALTANTNQSAIDVSALAALNFYDSMPYGAGNVDITSALASALGLAGDVIGGNTGITGPGGTSCSNPGTTGCYNGIITVTNDPGTPLYYDNQGGTEASDAYDFYSVVEHETDEILGTASCISTTQGAALSDGCPGTGTPSAVDLFRYNAPGTLALDTAACIGTQSCPAGAYFSYDGGNTNGAIGDGGMPKVYNTLFAGGEDYADFLSSSPCQANQAIQDAEGCPGEDAGLFITNDGGAEINILNAVGYDLIGVPEPSTWALLGASLALLAFLRLRNRDRQGADK